MNYKVKVELRVRRLIASWGLPRDLLLAEYDRLFPELPADPDRHLVDRLPPLRYFAYRFLLEDRTSLPRLHHFFFAVDRRDNVGELHILGANHSTAAEEN